MVQTALFQAFDTLNLQRVKTFGVPPVTLCGRARGEQLRAASANAWVETSVRDGRQLLHQWGLTAGLTRSPAVKGIAMTLWPCPVGERASPTCVQPWRSCVNQVVTG